MRNSIVRQDNWLVMAKCALSNGTFGEIFETQVNTKEHTYLVPGHAKWKTGEKVRVRYKVWDEVVEKQIKRDKQRRKHNVQAHKRTGRVREETIESNELRWESRKSDLESRCGIRKSGEKAVVGWVGAQLTIWTRCGACVALSSWVMQALSVSGAGRAVKWWHDAVSDDTGVAVQCQVARGPYRRIKPSLQTGEKFTTRRKQRWLRQWN